MKSGFLYKTFSGRASGMQLAGLADILDQAKHLPGNEYRKVMRDWLKKAGFNWNRTSGSDPADYTNIDGFGTQNLENLIRAYKEFGFPISDIHNRGLYNQDNTKTYHSIKQVYLDHEDEYNTDPPPPGEDPNNTGDTGDDPVLDSNRNYGGMTPEEIMALIQAQNAGNGGSSGTPPWLPFALLGGGAFALIMVLR